MSTRTAPTIDHYMTRLPITVGPTEPLSHAAKEMRKHQFHHLPVVDGGELVGVLSLYDVQLLGSFHAFDLDEVPVEDVMTREPYSVAPDAHLDQVVARMASDRVGSAVIVEDGEVVGIFTTHDAMVALFHQWKPGPP